MTIDPREIAADLMHDAARDITPLAILQHLEHAYGHGHATDAVLDGRIDQVLDLIATADIDIIWPEEQQ